MLCNFKLKNLRIVLGCEETTKLWLITTLLVAQNLPAILLLLSSITFWTGLLYGCTVLYVRFCIGMCMLIVRTKI